MKRQAYHGKTTGRNGGKTIQLSKTYDIGGGVPEIKKPFFNIHTTDKLY
jgi:hypothetical protein